MAFRKAALEPFDAILPFPNLPRSFDEAGNSLIVDDTGNVYLRGEHQGSVDFGGGTLEPTVRRAIFLLALDPTFGYRWQLGLGRWGIGSEIVRCGSDDVMFAAPLEDTVDYRGGALTSAGGSDIGFVRLTRAGTHVSSVRFGGSMSEYPFDLAIAPDGAVLITGSFSAPFDFGTGELVSAGVSDVFLARVLP